MKKFKGLFNLKSPSFLIVILPYIGFNWLEIYYSPFYNLQSVVFLFCCLFIIEFFFKLMPNLNRYYTSISIISLTLTLITFYGLYLVWFIQKNIELDIRGRLLLPIITGFFFFVVYIMNRRFKNYKLFNIYFLIFGVVTFVANISKAKNKIVDINKFNTNYINIEKSDKKIKPIILIISDEYNSPDGLYKVYKDSSVYDFSKKLVKNGWLVRNSFYSHETSTILSLASLFNFNLSKNSEYQKMTVADIGIKKLVHSSVYDSLKAKNISIINYGIFDIGKFKPLNKLYSYPLNFFEHFFEKTIVFPIILTGKLGIDGIQNEYFPAEEHNKFIINNLNNNLSKIIDPHFFIYVHLFMPHGPMQYKPEFPLLKNKNLKNYMPYWHFTNHKLISLLNSLINSDKYRIIFSGDHGFRGDPKINPHNTFTAFYGFDKGSVDSINSVQDLGSLINSGY